MQADMFLLADHAQVAEGKLYLAGGGWTRLTVARIPIRRRAALAIALLIDASESGERHSFRVDMQTPGDRVTLGEGQFEGEAFEGPSESFLIAINTDLAIEAEGQYEFILSVDSDEIKRTGFEVVTAP